MDSHQQRTSFEYPPDYKPRFASWLKWCPTSPESLAEAEAKIFHSIGREYKTSFITVDKDCHIRTLVVNPAEEDHGNNIPVVFMHGFLGGIGLFIKNIIELSKTRRVFALDLPGFGRSSRVHMGDTSDKVEEAYVDLIEKWRIAVQLDSFVLVGHSLGGYLSCAYTLRHSTQVKHLVLADPWGVGIKPEEKDVVYTRHGENIYLSDLNLRHRIMFTFIGNVNALSVVRALGPLGPYALRKWRPDLEERFSGLLGSGVIHEYLYHSNTQLPTGEEAFRALQNNVVWAQNPMLKRLGDLDDSVAISVIYGASTWMDITHGQSIERLRPRSHFELYIINGGGHHVYFDQPGQFNSLVYDICCTIDNIDSKNTSSL